MAKFRKKPIVIDAEQLNLSHSHVGHILIETLEGPLIARHGDWIITGVQGEKYPCKPDIFEMTYEAINE